MTAHRLEKLVEELGWNISNVNDRTFRLQLSNACEHLPYRHRRVLELYYGFGGEKPHSFGEISKIFQRTEARMGQIKKAGINEIRPLGPS